MKHSIAAVAIVVLAFSGATPVFAGRGAFLPTYHPKPCDGGDCQADDPKSGMPCQGLLCTLVPAKSMQPPVTASQAAEIGKARAAAEAAQAAAAPPPPAPVAPKARTRSAARKAKGAAVAKATTAKTVAPMKAAEATDANKAPDPIKTTEK